MRGCQRKIILLKGTDSQIFDEAYFLLRRGAEHRNGEEIVREADAFSETSDTQIVGTIRESPVCTNIEPRRAGD